MNWNKHEIIISRNDKLISLAALTLYIPATGFFGLKMLILLTLSLLTGYFTETITAKLRKQPFKEPGLTAWIIFPLLFPPAFPLYMSVISIFFGILIATAFFGGHGRSFISPVTVGITFALLSFPKAFGFGWTRPFTDWSMGWTHWQTGIVTIDHPIQYYLTKGQAGLSDIMSGVVPQIPGAALPGLLMIIIIVLLLLKAIDRGSLILFVSVVFGLQLTMTIIFPENFKPMTTLLIGQLLPAVGLILADNRYLARTRPGRYWSMTMTAVIFLLIHNLSSFAEGIFFSILFYNIFAPIIDEGIIKARRKEAVL